MSPDPPPDGPPSPSLGFATTSGTSWEARAVELLRQAEAYGSGIRLVDLARAMPEDAPRDPEVLAAWVGQHLQEMAVSDAVVYPASWEDGPARVRELEERSDRYVLAAQDQFLSSLGREREWLRSVAVTGSAAYGGARAGDDCDLLVVTRRGVVWTFLLLAFLRGRRRRGGDREDLAWCLNLVLDERSAPVEFRAPRGFHVAREALTARVVLGPDYYAELLQGATWMREQLPRLYAERQSPGPSAISPTGRSSWLARMIDPFVCLGLGAYLVTVGLVRDHRLRRAGRTEKSFRTRVGLGHLAYESREFETLARHYGS